MTAAKIVIMVPLFQPPHPSEFDELSPLGRRVMNVLVDRRKNELNIHSLLEESEMTHEIKNICLSPILELENDDIWKDIEITIDNGRRNGKKIAKAEENMSKIVSTQIKSPSEHKQLIGDINCEPTKDKLINSQNITLDYEKINSHKINNNVENLNNNIKNVNQHVQQIINIRSIESNEQDSNERNLCITNEKLCTNMKEISTNNYSKHSSVITSTNTRPIDIEKINKLRNKLDQYKFKSKIKDDIDVSNNNNLIDINDATHPNNNSTFIVPLNKSVTVNNNHQIDDHDYIDNTPLSKQGKLFNAFNETNNFIGDIRKYLPHAPLKSKSLFIGNKEQIPQTNSEQREVMSNAFSSSSTKFNKPLNLIGKHGQVRNKQRQNFEILEMRVLKGPNETINNQSAHDANKKCIRNKVENNCDKQIQNFNSIICRTNVENDQIKKPKQQVVEFLHDTIASKEPKQVQDFFIKTNDQININLNESNRTKANGDNNNVDIFNKKLQENNDLSILQDFFDSSVLEIFSDFKNVENDKIKENIENANAKSCLKLYNKIDHSKAVLKNNAKKKEKLKFLEKPKLNKMFISDSQANKTKSKSENDQLRKKRRKIQCETYAIEIDYSKQRPGPKLIQTKITNLFKPVKKISR